MLIWLAIVGGSAVVGLVTARLSRGHRHSAAIAGAVAWLALLVVLLVNEYVMPYSGGGASMWPIAQLFGGTIAAAVAAATCAIARKSGQA